METIPYLLRDANEGDHSFIYNSWLKSYRDSPVTKHIPNSIYYENHHNIIENLLNNNKVVVVVVCNPEDKGQIFAYSVSEYRDGKVILHWVYTKHPFRGFGLGRMLVTRFINTYERVYYTHFTKPSSKLLTDKLQYNPYLLRSE